LKINQENFIRLLKKKKTEALDYFVDNYSNLVFKVIISVLSSDKREEAVECLNDVILKVWNNISYFDDSKGNFSSWLIAITKYNAIDYQRKIVKMAKQENIDDLVIKDECMVEDEIIAKENNEEIIDMIISMGEPDRDIFFRHYIVGESINEICDKLKLSRAAVDNRLSRGRKELKKKIILVDKGVIL
jgi:RNA polymerase sigma-70 factor (ECF subfamily)